MSQSNGGGLFGWLGLRGGGGGDAAGAAGGGGMSSTLHPLPEHPPELDTPPSSRPTTPKLQLRSPMAALGLSRSSKPLARTSGGATLARASGDGALGRPSAQLGRQSSMSGVMHKDASTKVGPGQGLGAGPGVFEGRGPFTERRCRPCSCRRRRRRGFGPAGLVGPGPPAAGRGPLVGSAIVGAPLGDVRGAASGRRGDRRGAGPN